MIDLIDYINGIQKKRRSEPEIMLKELFNLYCRASYIGYEKHLEKERKAFEDYNRWESELKFLKTYDDIWQMGQYHV